MTTPASPAASTNPTHPLDRRSFIAAAGLLSAAAITGRADASSFQPDRGRAGGAGGGGGGGGGAGGGPHPGDAPRPGPVAIASGNGLQSVRQAVEMMQAGADPTVAAVMSVAIVEADPEDMTVGLGGLPDENGEVTLDAACMHGPTHKAGGVAALKDTVHAAQVALKVLQTTDHALLVGEGAIRFARMHGFPAQNLLTEKARIAWLRWKSGLSTGDDWLDDKDSDWSPDGTTTVPRTNGTIHCSCLTPDRAIGCCTTTSGLSYKIPGRVGDTPLIGAGLYCDNEVGSAGCTGRGEASIENLAAFSMVQEMAKGLTPTEACLATLDVIARRSVKQLRLRTDRGEPNFGLTLYAVRKDGAYGSATMRQGARFAVADSSGARLEPCAYLYARS